MPMNGHPIEVLSTISHLARSGIASTDGVEKPALKGSRCMKPFSFVNSRLFWGSVAFVVLIVLPLYAALVVVAARTKLFDLHGGEFTDEQYKAIWAFLGVALGTAATIMGAILTKSNNDKNLAQQIESERRQKLDTAVQALSLIKSDDKYAPKAVTAGALATLVHLGHPTIAMRSTEVASRDDAVAVETVVWLIDQVLRGAVDDSTNDAMLTSKQEAAWLLNSLTSQLTEPSGEFQFPTCLLAAWPEGLQPQTNKTLLSAMIGLLVSKDPSWWDPGNNTWTWVLYSIDELVQDASVDTYTRQLAATYGMKMLTVIGDRSIDGITDTRGPEEVKKRLQAHAFEVEVDDEKWLDRWNDLSRWCDLAVAAGPAT